MAVLRFCHRVGARRPRLSPFPGKNDGTDQGDEKQDRDDLKRQQPVTEQHHADRLDIAETVADDVDFSPPAGY